MQPVASSSSGQGMNGLHFRVWRVALACFVLAAATGVLIRFSLLHGFPFGLQFGDVRHAHSHLMFFGWVTPPLMMLLLQFQGGSISRQVRWLLGCTLLAALASYVPFLLSGYRPLPLFGRELPVSMIVSGLNGLPWIWFMVMYVLRDKSRPRHAGSSYFRAALLMLLFSVISVALLAIAGSSGASPVTINALAFLFLELFAEGWFGLAIIGLAWRMLNGARSTQASRFGLGLLILALTVRCVADVFVKTGQPAFEPVALAGSGLAGLGLLMTLAPLWPVLRRERPGLWHACVALLSAKGVFDLILSQPYLASWNEAAGLNVFYLHAFLLGAVSFGLIAAVRGAWSPAAFRYPWAFAAAVFVMLAALLPVTGAWPAAWSGRWALQAAAWTSVGPPAVVLLVLLTGPHVKGRVAGIVRHDQQTP